MPTLEQAERMDKSRLKAAGDDGGWFWCTNALFDGGHVAKMGASAALVYFALLRLGCNDGQAYPSVRTLVEMIGLQSEAVTRAIRKLVELGYVKAIRTSRRKPFTYTLCSIPSVPKTETLSVPKTETLSVPKTETNKELCTKTEVTKKGGASSKNRTVHQGTAPSKQPTRSSPPPQYEAIDKELTDTLRDTVRRKQGDTWKLPGKAEDHYTACRLLRTEGNAELSEGVSEDRIRAVITWLNTPGNWWIETGNVRSMLKFREKFVTIETQMRDDLRKDKRYDPPGEPRERSLADLKLAGRA